VKSVIDEYMAGFFEARDPDTIKVRAYSRFQPLSVVINRHLSLQEWAYDVSNGWVEMIISHTPGVSFEVEMQLGTPLAPLHPYFSGILPGEASEK
jgi:hypothetical protein